MSGDLKWLADRAKIHDVTVSYAMSVDFCDWDRYKSIFTDEFDRDLSSFTGKPAERVSREQHISEAKAGLRGFDFTQHRLWNTDISIEGDRAQAIVYMSAEHAIVSDGDKNQCVIDGFYTFKFTSDGENWKICGLTLTALSIHGDHSVFEVAQSRVAAMNETQRNASRYTH